MQDRTINNALLELRKRIIRGDGRGLTEVEALLQMRSVDMPRVLPPQRADVAKRMEMRRIILGALSESPMTLPELSAYVAQKRPDADAERAYDRTAQALHKMLSKGLVRREGRVWALAP